MSWRTKSLGIVALAICLWVGPAREAAADQFDCLHNGDNGCSFSAGCNGDYAEGLCVIQCYIDHPGCGQPDCSEVAGSAGCGDPKMY